MEDRIVIAIHEFMECVKAAFARFIEAVKKMIQAFNELFIVVEHYNIQAENEEAGREMLWASLIMTSFISFKISFLTVFIMTRANMGFSIGMGLLFAVFAAITFATYHTLDYVRVATDEDSMYIPTENEWADYYR